MASKEGGGGRRGRGRNREGMENGGAPSRAHSPPTSILWLNYSGRKIIQSPLLYRLSLEFYPEICSRSVNGEFFFFTFEQIRMPSIKSNLIFLRAIVFFPRPFGALIAPNLNVTANENEINEHSVEAETKPSVDILVFRCEAPTKAARRSKQGWIDARIFVNKKEERGRRGPYTSGEIIFSDQRIRPLTRKLGNFSPIVWKAETEEKERRRSNRE